MSDMPYWTLVAIAVVLISAYIIVAARIAYPGMTVQSVVSDDGQGSKKDRNAMREALLRIENRNVEQEELLKRLEE